MKLIYKLFFIVITIICNTLSIQSQEKNSYKKNDEFTQNRYFYSLSSDRNIVLFAGKTWCLKLWYDNKQIVGSSTYFKDHGYWEYETEDNITINFQYFNNFVDMSLPLPTEVSNEINLELIEIGDSVRRDSVLINNYINNNTIQGYDLINLNNKAYYLQQLNFNEEAVFLLKNIVKYFPSRTVAYINLGDAYWGLNETDQAKKAYQKYMELMKANGKESKIPQRVFEQVK